MPRQKRKLSIRGCYHIILRGIDRQILFFDNADRIRFLHSIARFRKDTDLTIAAYCLMDNHIHILLQTAEPPGLFVKKTASSYVLYFNRKYDRVGHLFQDRFVSEPVDSDGYYLRVFRYILRNPAKAGLGRTEKYPWSSWSELQKRRICNIDTAIAIAGGIDRLKAFVLADDFIEDKTDICPDDNDTCLEYTVRHNITDTEAVALISRIMVRRGFKIISPLEIAGCPKEIRDSLLKEMKAEGLSIRQLSRLTAINRNTIQRA